MLRYWFVLALYVALALFVWTFSDALVVLGLVALAIWPMSRRNKAKE